MAGPEMQTADAQARITLPGRVAIVLRQETRHMPQGRPPGDTFFQLMDEIRAGQKARGFVPRSADEVEADRQRLREEAEEEIDEAIRHQLAKQTLGRTPEALDTSACAWRPGWNSTE